MLKVMGLVCCLFLGFMIGIFFLSFLYGCDCVSMVFRAREVHADVVPSLAGIG
jgi:hypothetical protein